jgi:AhpD family alkylhydroperoxidase
MGVAQAFEGSSFSPVEKQVVLLTVSFENECRYCVAAHSTIAEMSQLPPEVVEALRDGSEIADSKLEALRRLTREVVRKRGWIEGGELDAFFAAGFSRAQFLELVVGVTQKTLSNYINHVAHTPVDEAFAAHEWQHPAKRKASVGA